MKTQKHSMESKEPQLFFKVGSKVDVTNNEEDFKGSWYTATIIDPKTIPGPEARTLFWVKYATLVTEGDSPEPLTEYAHVSNLRPSPPPPALTDHYGILDLNDVVEASYRDGWWTGIVVKVIDGDGGNGGDGGGGGLKFLVAFEYPYEEIEFRLDELRLQFDWVNGKWVRPPKMELIDVIEDTSVTGVSNQPDSVLTKGSSTTAALKRAKTDSESIKLRKNLKRKNAEQAPRVLTHCEFNSSLTKPTSQKAHTIRISTDKRGSNIDCKSMSLKMHKRFTKSGSPIKNLDFSEENVNQMTMMGRKKKLIKKFLSSLEDDEPIIEGEHVHEKAIVLTPASEAGVLEARGDFSSGTEKSPVREVFVVSETDYMTPDLGTTIDKQAINISEMDPVNPDLEITIDRQGTDISEMDYVTPDLETTIDKLVTKISEIDSTTPDLETTVDKRGVCMSKTPALCPDSRDQPENIISCSAVVAQTDETNGKGPSWPFVKSSGIWKIVDSMDIFTTMPQMPHFSPLIELEENSRERLAICMMMKFAFEVDKITRLSPDNLKSSSIIDGSLNNLMELESHGFDVAEIKAYCKDLLHGGELQEKKGEVDSKIRNCKAEKTAAENEITKLVEMWKSIEEKLESAKSVKHLKDRELANLESEKGILSGKIRSLQLDTKRKLLFSYEHSPHL